VGGSTIAALTNAVKPLAMPFVFGGDGATFCVPPSVLPQVKKALRGCQDLALDGLKLELRVGLVPVADLTKKVLVCRFQRTVNMTQYFFMGGGLDEADGLVKSQPRYALPGDIEADANFSGFECRWNQIPSAKEVTFSLLVKPRCATPQQTFAWYREFMVVLTRIMGDVQQHHPLNEKGLNLSFNVNKIKAEALTKAQPMSAWNAWRMRWKIRLENAVGWYWLTYKKQVNGVDWGGYKQDLIKNTDYIKLDDLYRTVMSADQKSVNALLAWLDVAYQQGQVFYGCHQTHSAVITCLVAQTGVEHVHFVDSAEGGYAMAAKQLKAQIKQATAGESG
jgi:hypothetical protein